MNIKNTMTAMIFGLSLPLVTLAAPFGNEADVSYAKKVWKASVGAGFAGENAIVTRPYKGKPPHGMILDLMEKEVTISISGHP